MPVPTLHNRPTHQISQATLTHQASGSLFVDGAQQDDPSILTKDDYDAFAQRFCIIVATSTFTATAIITVLALVRDILDDISLDFEIAMFLGILAAATHFLVIIMAGRAATLAFRTARERHRKDAFKHFMTYFNICEQLHLWATILFINCLLVALNSVFPHKEFAYGVYVYAGLGVLAIFLGTPFWKDSVLVYDLVALYERFYGQKSTKGEGGQRDSVAEEGRKG
ncbi:hypothetical protein AX16_007208 [Volvariella volvacea WC 439]|nr:hypothetical protein AX16_007208 [Volvariella volvacea WC 439]